MTFLTVRTYTAQPTTEVGALWTKNLDFIQLLLLFNVFILYCIYKCKTFHYNKQQIPNFIYKFTIFLTNQRVFVFYLLFLLFFPKIIQNVSQYSNGQNSQYFAFLCNGVICFTPIHLYCFDCIAKVEIHPTFLELETICLTSMILHLKKQFMNKIFFHLNHCAFVTTVATV